MKKYNLISICITIFSLLAFVLTANAATQDSSTFFLNPGDSSTSASSGSWNGGGPWAGGDSSSAADSSADAGFVSQTNTNQSVSPAAKAAIIAGAFAAVAGGTALILHHHNKDDHNNNSGTTPSIPLNTPYIPLNPSYIPLNALVKVQAEFKDYKASNNDHPTVTITFTNTGPKHEQYQVNFTEGQSGDSILEIPPGTYDVSGSSSQDYTAIPQYGDVIKEGSTQPAINVIYNKGPIKPNAPVTIHVTGLQPKSNAKVTIMFDDHKYKPQPDPIFMMAYTEGSKDPTTSLPEGTYDVSGSPSGDYTCNTQKYIIKINQDSNLINLTYNNVKTPVDISVSGLPSIIYDFNKLKGSLTNTEDNTKSYSFNFQANGAVDPDPLNVTPGTYSIGVDSYKTIDGYTYDATASLEKEYHISDKQMSIPITYSVTAVPVTFNITGLPTGDEQQAVNVTLDNGHGKKYSKTIKNGETTIPYVAVGQDPYTVAAADFTYNGKSYTADSIPPVTITKQTTIPITYHEDANPKVKLTFNVKNYHHIDEVFMKIRPVEHDDTYDQPITDGQTILLPKGTYAIIPQEIACRGGNPLDCGKVGDRYAPQHAAYNVDLEKTDQSVDISYSTDALPNKLQKTIVTIKRPQDDQTASCKLNITFIKGRSDITDTRTVSNDGSKQDPYSSTKLVHPGTYEVTATDIKGNKDKDYEVNIKIPNSSTDHPNWLVVGLYKRVKYTDPINVTFVPKPPTMDHVFAGIWQNNSASNPFIPLSEVNKGYNLVTIQSGSVAIDGTASFEPTSDYKDNGRGGKAGFKNDLKALQAEGTKVLLSFGDSLGNTYDFNSTNYMTFVNSVIPLIHEYGFDGINFGYGPNSELTSDNGLYLSMAIEKIKSIYEQQYGKQLLITASPDIAQTYWQKNWETGTGGYDTAIKNHDLDYVFVGLLSDKCLNGYNNPNGTCYQPGTVSFITSQTDATVRHWINDLGLTEVGAKKLFVPQFALYNNQPASAKGTPEIIKQSLRCMATHKAADCTDDPINDKNSYIPALAPYKIANISNTYINGDDYRNGFFLNSLHSCVVDGNCTDKVY